VGDEMDEIKERIAKRLHDKPEILDRLRESLESDDVVPYGEFEEDGPKENEGPRGP